jgi:ABC-2 type transport system ATP-binding protein
MIHVESLTRYYRDVCAVDGITFDVPRGEVMGLLGPNGAGKTTTLRMLTGFLTPSSGTIAVKDYRIDRDSLKIRRLMGYLPEAAPLYPEMLVYDYLTYIARIRGIEAGEIAASIRELGRMCGLTAVMHQPIGELSKGYRQRVGLAHAMMGDPEILVLDEPTSGLDPNQIVEIREIIREIGRRKTVIFSTHILSEAEATCDRIVIINQGRIVADGSTETLKREVGGKRVLHILLTGAGEEQARSVFESQEGVGPVESRLESGERLHLELTLEGEADLRPQIYETIRQRDWILLEFRQQRRSLEDVFRQLTREN